MPDCGLRKCPKTCIANWTAGSRRSSKSWRDRNFGRIEDCPYPLCNLARRGAPAIISLCSPFRPGLTGHKGYSECWSRMLHSLRCEWRSSRPNIRNLPKAMPPSSRHTRVRSLSGCCNIARTGTLRIRFPIRQIEGEIAAKRGKSG